MKKKYKIALLSISILLIASVFIGTSYSLWQDSNVQEGTNEIKVGCFSVTFMNLASYNGHVAGDINLVNTYPISDSRGNELVPYTFSIKNECSVATDYTINLETLNTTNYNNDYLRVKFDNESEGTNNASTIYTSIEEGTVILTNEAVEARVLGRGHLEENDEKIYSLRLWVDKSATTTTPNVMGKKWNGKVVVYSEASENTPNEPNAVDTIKDLVDGADPTSTDVIGNTGLAYDGTEDNNLRYVGQNPNNYVQFNNESWQIIGAMNNVQTEGGQTKSLLKLRRKVSLGSYSWDSSDSQNLGGGVNQWGASGAYEGADLMRELNTDYLGNITVGTDGKWYSYIQNQKTANKPTVTISNEAQKQIETVVWNTGSPNNVNGTYLAEDSELLTYLYSFMLERGSTNGKICTRTDSLWGPGCNDTITRTSTWTGKVGLITPSDFGFATAGGNTKNRNTCINTQIKLDQNNVPDCVNNNWLYTSNSQWTISPNASTYYNNFTFYVTARGGISACNAHISNNVYPVVYLKSSVKIIGGDGSQASPYILE